MIGYTDYDHAAWVENQASAIRRGTERGNALLVADPKRCRAKRPLTKGWLTLPVPLPEWQGRAMHILGMTFGGIYNAPIAWDSLDWGDGRYLHVPIRNPMATFDYTTLTAFVFLCHEAAIRGQIAPHTPGYLRISMWPRERRGGSNDRHPTLEDAVQRFNAALCPNHPVRLPFWKAQRPPLGLAVESLRPHIPVAVDADYWTGEIIVKGATLAHLTSWRGWPVITETPVLEPSE